MLNHRVQHQLIMLIIDNQVCNQNKHNNNNLMI